jgi:carboxypeptidase Taq
VTAAPPPDLAELRARLAVMADLRGAEQVLSWDQNVFMPPGGAEARAEQLATMERLLHDRLMDPELGRLLDSLESWMAGADPDSDDVRMVRQARRDHDKATRVPAQLAEDMAREAARGYSAWLEARETGEFARFQDALASQVDLRRRYAACFPEAEHPYDVLLDDFEPGMTTAQLRPLFAELTAQLRPLVDEAADPDATPNGGVFTGRFPIEDQRRALLAILAAKGFEEQHWRLDTAPHPFAQSPGHGDYRLTTRYSEVDFAYSFYSALHEFGHGLYDAGLPEELARTNLHDCASLGVHESQSRMWENLVGRSRPYATWLLPRLRELLPGSFDRLDTDGLYRGANVVQRSLIRTEADETTYNLHVALRLELELALLEGGLEVAVLPTAWNEGMKRLLGVDVPDDRVGVLQDVHWAIGSFGYFPTYTLGNLMAAQLWTCARRDLPDLDGQIERGEFRPLAEWLRRNVHRHGRKFDPPELLRRVTGEDLRTEPFVSYLRTKLTDAGVIA